MTAATSAETTANIVEQIKRQGVFDDFRKACLADLEDNQQYKELVARVESFVNGFLANINPDDPHTNKHRVREQLRSKLTSQDFFHRSLNSIIQQLISQPKIDSDLVPQVELATYRHFGLKPPDRLLSSNDVEEPQKIAEAQDTTGQPEEEQLDIDEGAELSVQFETFDDMNVQNMDIDSDADEHASSSSPHSQPVADDISCSPSESKSVDQPDTEGDCQKTKSPTDDNVESDQPTPAEPPSQGSTPTATDETPPVEEPVVDEEKKKEGEPFVDSVMEALQPISPDSSSNSRPDDGSDEVDARDNRPVVDRNSRSSSLADHLQSVSPSPESEDRPEPSKKRRGRVAKRPKLEEAPMTSAPPVDAPEDADNGRRKRPTRNRRPTDPDFVYY